MIRDDQQYRRGLVLGLTMAEVMLLLLFVLLLALSMLFEHEQRERERLQEELTAKESEIEVLSEKIDKIAGRQRREQSFSDTFRELVLMRKKNHQLSNKISALEEGNKRLDQELKTIRKEMKDYQYLERELAAIDEDAGAKELVQRLEQGREAEKVAEAVAEAGLPTDPDKLKEQVAYYKRLARLKGVEKAPCWITPDTPRRPEYIFDIVLRAGGLVIYDRKLPHRQAEKAKLPIDGVTFEKTLAPEQFREAIRPLYLWSKSEDCRFFVRIFDRTPSDQKALYKKELWIVAAYFYYYEVRDNSIEPGSV